VYECSSMRRKINVGKGIELAETRREFNQIIEHRIARSTEADAKESSSSNSDGEFTVEENTSEQFKTRQIPTEEW